MYFSVFQSPYFDKKNLVINRHIFLLGSRILAKNVKDTFLKNLLSFLVCSQIWLNLLVNDCQFGLHHNLFIFLKP